MSLSFFLSGVEKTKIPKAFKPHIFFDDQDVHLIVAVYPINLKLHARATMQPKPYGHEATHASCNLKYDGYKLFMTVTPNLQNVKHRVLSMTNHLVSKAELH